MAELLTLAQTAKRLGVGETWLWQQTAKGRLPTVRLPGGRLVRIREQDLAEFVESCVEGGRNEIAATGQNPVAARRTGRASAQNSITR